MSVEKLAQLTQELLPMCSIAAKPTIIKLEMLFLFQEQRIKAFMEYLGKERRKSSEEVEQKLIEVYEKAEEML